MTPYPAARILIVDDEPANVLLVQRLLEHEGYREISATTDAREAVPRFEAVRPDLVVLDLLMPHRSGFEVLADLRALMEAWPVPAQILILTADAAARRTCYELGERNFLSKPIEDLPDFYGRVQTLLEIRMLGVALDRLRGPRA